MTARRVQHTTSLPLPGSMVDLTVAMPSPFAAWSWPQWSTSRPWAVGVDYDGVRTVYGTTETEVAAAAAAVRLYVAWLAGGLVPDVPGLAGLRDLHLAAVPRLAGRDLACHCRPGYPCHGDALLVLATGVSPRVLVEDLAGAA